MAKINWGGFVFESNLLVEVKECCTCREKKPINEILGNGMCQRCTDIENNMMERLAGKWGQMVINEQNARYNSEIIRILKHNHEEEKRSGWFLWR